MRFFCCTIEWPSHILKCGIVVGLFLGLLSLGVFNAFLAVPNYYAEQMSVSSTAMNDANDEMVRKVEQFNHDVTKPGKWRVEFTEEQINAWLANELLARLPYALPPNVFDPRVAIEPDLAKVAAKYSCGNLAAVLSLEVDPFVASEKNDLAIRICAAKIGSVPGLADRARQSIHYASLRSRIHIQWMQDEGEWVGKFKFDGKVFDLDPNVQLREIELSDGRVCLSGVTLPPPEPIGVPAISPTFAGNWLPAAVAESVHSVIKPAWSDEIMPRETRLFHTANSSTQASRSRAHR